MNFQVILLPQAERDVAAILAWLHDRSPQGAAAWYRSWMATIESLETTAGGCGRAPEDKDHEATIRQILFKTRRGRPYRALFAIRAATVYVLHVRGSGQNVLNHDELQLPGE